MPLAVMPDWARRLIAEADESDGFVPAFGADDRSRDQYRSRAFGSLRHGSGSTTVFSRVW